MEKWIFAILIIVCSAVNSWSQTKPYPLHTDAHTPNYYMLMQAENPDIAAVQKAYNEYYTGHKFIKNSYTQYYKRWLQWARRYMISQSSVRIPSAEEIGKKETQLKQIRNTENTLLKGGSLWSFAGPKETYDTDGQQVVTWQTNIYHFDIAPSNPNILYAGGETGGLWKTTDKGLNWTLSTKNVLHGSFGAVKIHPTDPNIVYATTSNKIIKTVDGGLNWNTIYNANNFWAHEIYINPTNTNIVCVASEQGLLRSTNGGSSWNTEFASFTWSVKQSTANNQVVYAIRDSGNSSQFVKSTDGGDNWTVMNNGWYQPIAGDAVEGAIIATCPSNPNKIYAYLIGNGPTLNGYIGVFVSYDEGVTWTNTNPSNNIGGTYTIPNNTNLAANDGSNGFNQGFYDMAIVVNPLNDQELIAGGTSWFKSTDGGITWNGLGGYVGNLGWSHPDIQWCVAQGNDLWIASDGGLNYSTNFGQSHIARMNGISGADLWGFDCGWNEDILVGGRYHNGNMAWHQSFPDGKFYRMGGAESPTGYVSPSHERKTYFSDIGGYKINGGFDQGVTYFNFGATPNESYAYYANSELTWHPQCWNKVYTGTNNNLMISEDGGSSFAILHAFPGSPDHAVYEIEISRANPNVMYVSQWNGSDDAIWRSEDGGILWTACIFPSGNNNKDRAKIAASATNPNELWLAYTYGSNGMKVYRSIDGGQSWINLTTSLLDEVTVQDIMAQHGTNGGLYLGTDAGVFYRNNNHPDWQVYSSGLPLSVSTNRIKPFYKDAKIRLGAWGMGVWEAPLYEPSSVIAQAMSDKLFSACIRDTFYFDDYSILQHDGCSWTWDIPGTSYLSGQDSRTPKAIFASSGIHTVTMTLHTPSGNYTSTIEVLVGNDCEADELPGHALYFDGVDDYVTIPALATPTNSITIMTWIKADGIQSDYAGIVFTRGNLTTAGLNFRSNNELGYHWNGSQWWWASNTIMPSDEWTHIALVISPTHTKIYKNGIAATNNVANDALPFESTIYLGKDPNFDNRNFKGWMDELAIYNTALTQDQIREQMHLTKYPALSPNLLLYYQFNRIVYGNTEYDNVQLRHGSLANGVLRVPSTGPFAGGTSDRMSVTNSNTTIAPNTQCQLLWNTGTNPNGELVISKLNHLPHLTPNCSAYTGDEHYWVINNYGSNNSFTGLSSIQVGGITVPPFGNMPYNSYQVYKRVFNAEGDTWADPYTNTIDGAEGLSGHLIIDNNTPSDKINSSAQFFINHPMNNQLITGSIEICSTEPFTYRIEPLPIDNVSYNWVITSGNGTIVQGQGTNEVIVSWTGTGAGTIDVTVSY